MSFRDPRTGPKKINGHTEKTIRFEDHHYSSPITSPSTERQISVRKHYSRFYSRDSLTFFE